MLFLQDIKASLICRQLHCHMCYPLTPLPPPPPLSSTNPPSRPPSFHSTKSSSRPTLSCVSLFLICGSRRSTKTEPTICRICFSFLRLTFMTYPFIYIYIYRYMLIYLWHIAYITRLPRPTTRGRRVVFCLKRNPLDRQVGKEARTEGGVGLSG